MWVVFAFANVYRTVYSVFKDQSSNDTLTNDIVSFEQLGPELLLAVCY